MIDLSHLPAVSDDTFKLLETIHQNSLGWRGLLTQVETALSSKVRAFISDLSVSAGLPFGPAVPSGWTSSLSDGHGDFGFVHLTNPLAQTFSQMVLSVDAPLQTEVRPLLPVEEQCLRALMELVLSALKVPLFVSHIDPKTFASQKATRFVFVALTVTIGETDGLFSIWLHPAAADQLFGDRRATVESLVACTGDSSIGRAIHRPTRVRLATFVAQKCEIEQLGAGDVLLPKAWMELDKPNRGLLCFGSFPVFQVEINYQDGITVTRSDTMSHDEQEMNVTAEKPALVECNEDVLELVVGEINLSLQEVLSLQPGRIFKLADANDLPVDIMLGQKRIGTGELIELNGRLGLRIIEVDQDR